MELLQLRYFLVAAKYQHMTKAAEVLQIAQPALSQSIKRLEQELGVSLFEREKRNIRLNDAGRFLEQKLLPIMAALDEIPSEIQKKERMNQRTIHLNLLAATRLVTDCIIAYKELHPEIMFRLVQNPDREHDDICISTAFPGTPLRYGEQLLLQERFFMAVPAGSPYAGLDGVDLACLKDEGFISLSNNRPIRRICERFCLEAGFACHTVCETDNPESVRNLIAAGLGVGFWPEYSWGLLSTPKIRLLPIINMHCSRDIVLTRRSHGACEKAADDFCRFLVSYAHAEGSSADGKVSLSKDMDSR